MSELNDKLLEIKRQKDEYILPENLKKDVTAFGVTGTLEQDVNLNMTKVVSTSSTTNSDTNIFKKCIISFGSNVIFDLQGSTNAGFLFNGCANLTKIPIIQNTSSLLYCQYMFAYMYNVNEMPYFDTSSVKNFYCFAINSSFEIVPVLNLQSATNLQNMFSGCSHLNEDSLNNILSMCTSATNYSNTKTLKYIGLSSAQAQVCTTLSNYQDFVNAGWTTGY